MAIPKIRIQLAETIKRARSESGQTQEEVAELIGVSTRYYQMLESKKPTAITVDTLEKLAKVLKTTPEKLLKFSNPKTSIK